MSGIIDFRTPAAGFDQPIEMWLACHDRMLRMIALLMRLREHLAAGGDTASAGVTAASILRYFNEAAPRHHEDEEVDLFPRLLARLDRNARNKVQGIVRKLSSEHARLDQRWAQLRPELVGIEATAAMRISDDAVVQFAAAYRNHIELENEVLAPAFRRAFGADELEAIGGAMAARRGVDWSELRVRDVNQT